MTTLVKRGYAETSDLKATNAGHVFSIRNNALAIENGTLWKLGNLSIANEAYEVSLPAAGDKVVLAHSVLYAYDTQTTLQQHEMYLRKEAGEDARAYELVERDRFAVADYMITAISATAGPQVGNYVKVDPATGLYTEIASIPSSGVGFVARINSLDYKSNLTLVRLEVIMNEQVSGITPTIGSLTVASVAGTNTGDTKITITEPKASAVNVYKYKVAASAQTVALGDDLTSWTTWDGSADITAASGQVITVAECSAAFAAQKVGNATVVAKA